ncbi:MAG: hypothetical protein LBV01_02840 [Deltaproteobacteria bacterium]|jgi:hypothetical protein|nr:hypothetical protein [Deltaproteobacteria bacterium]
MHPWFLFSSRQRRDPALFACALLLCLSSGCAGANYAPGPEFSPQTHDYLQADDTAAFNACVSLCSENTSLAFVTRTGCLDGCEQARAAWPLHGEIFSGRRECLDSLLRQDAAKEARIDDLRRWCDAKWSHVHNRKGCYRAAEAFYANLSPASVCGSDAAEAAAYGEALRQARQEAAEATPLPLPPDSHAAEATPPPPAAAAPEPPAAVPAAPQISPTPAAPPAPPSVTGATGAKEPEQRVTRMTQPAGPLEPPPYTPPTTPAASAQDTPPSSPPSSPRAAPPYLYDTPKYQDSPRGQAARPRVSGSGPEKNAPAAPAPMTPPATPPLAAPAPVIPAPLPESAPPSPPMPSTPPPVAAQPSAAQASPAPPATAQPATIPPATAQAAPVSPPAPAATAKPETPTPAPTEPKPPERALPKPQLPMPSPQQAKPDATGAAPAQSSPSSLMPPLPSTLNQPYNAPAIIMPQLDLPPEGAK